MPLLLLWMFFYFANPERGPEPGQARALYLRAANDETACRRLLALTSATGEKTDALMLGYRGAATMIMAKHVFDPFHKLSLFRRGKALLELAIGADRKNAELRYLRYGIQVHLPGFLGYNHDLTGDRRLMEEFLKTTGDGELKTMIRALLDKTAK